MSMSFTVIPKSDQLNFDSFISGQGKIIKITSVIINVAAETQKCTIHYEGENGRPYKPNKSMCRVLFKIWGEDENIYVGRHLSLYGDPTVRFGADEVGGILISHMSNIDNPVTVMLTKTRANKRPFTVQPLVLETDRSLDILKRNAGESADKGTESLQAWWKDLPPKSQALLKPHMEEYKKLANDKDAKPEERTS